MIASDFRIKNIAVNLPEKKSITWKSPSNIALVKYWGKQEPQLPENPSISFTLDACYTLTTIDFFRYTDTILESHNKSLNQLKIEKNISFDIFFEGKKNDHFKPKIKNFFARIIPYVPYLINYKLIIQSRNSFPHSSGIASSASSMAALALCIMSLEKKIYPKMTRDYFYKKASFLARLGSGSASRSIEGPLVVWGAHKKIKGSTNLYGIKFPNKIHPIFKNYHDTILLVDKAEKQVSSSIGHHLMKAHRFAKQRFKQANNNIAKLSQILQNGDLKSFITIVESEALTLHAMMMSSQPYFILMKPNTLQIINRIWAFRAETKSNICFTLDAGANVHILFPEQEKDRINQFIIRQLLPFCQKNHYICDSVGWGAKRFFNL